MSLICAVPSYAELSASIGQEVIVIAGLSATSLRLDKVMPVRRGGSVSFRALLSGGDPQTPVRNGTHLTRVGDYLVRLRLLRVWPRTAPRSTRHTPRPTSTSSSSPLPEATAQDSSGTS